jgi:zinc-finger
VTTKDGSRPGPGTGDKGQEVWTVAEWVGSTAEGTGRGGVNESEPCRPVGGLFPSPRSFFWLPVEGARHAVAAGFRGTVPGDSVTTLCDKSLVRVAVSDNKEWLWPTCLACWASAAREK